MHALGLALGLAPGFVWLFFYLKQDPKPEPKRLLFFTFLLGGISTLFALAVQVYLRNSGLTQSLESLNFTSLAALLPLTLFALSEEVAKFGAAYFAIHKSRYFDEPVDAMIYAIVAALGFATVENIAVLNNLYSEQTILASVFGVTFARLTGATLLHTLTAAFMGYYWAISIKKGGSSLFVSMGIIISTILHSGFNFLILNYENLIYPIILLILGAFFALEDFSELKSEK